MNVQRLIELLQECDPNSIVITHCDDLTGHCEIEQIEITKVYLNCNPDFGGPHLVESDAQIVFSNLTSEDPSAQTIRALMYDREAIDRLKETKPVPCVIV